MRQNTLLPHIRRFKHSVSNKHFRNNKEEANVLLRYRKEYFCHRQSEQSSVLKAHRLQAANPPVYQAGDRNLCESDSLFDIFHDP